MNTYTGAALASKIAAEAWAEDFADVLTVFNSEATEKALFGHFATTKSDTEAIEYAELCRAFIDLVDRKVLVREFHSDIANEQLEAMRAKFAPSTLPTPAHTPTLDPNAPRDYSQMTNSEFDRIPTSESRRLYKSNLAFRRRADHFFGGGK
jgi:hypothetical protein